MPIIRLENVTKIIKGRVLFEKINLAFDYGQMVFIVGETGCGKTTLLKMLAGLDAEYKGTITFQQEAKLSRQRARQIAFIHQRFPLISYYTIEENITLFQTIDPEKMRKVCRELDIEAYLASYPNQLSGGEKQRVAIARSLLKQAPLLLADEPTSSLGEKQAQEVMKLLKKQAENSLVIVVTHHRKLAEEYADYIYDMTKKEQSQFRRSKQDGGRHVHVFPSFQFSSFFKRQLSVLWQDKMRYVLPLLLWTITGLVFLVCFHVYDSFSQHLVAEVNKRIDGQYLRIETNETEDVWLSFASILKENKAQSLQPFHVLLNEQIKTYVLYAQKDPQYKQFYFEIVPLLHLDKNTIVMNQLFYQKSEGKVDQIYLQFADNGNEYDYLFSLTEVIDDGSLYQTPKLYVSYDFCVEQWPNYEKEGQFLYYLPRDTVIKQQLMSNKEARFLFRAQPKTKLTYYYSTYMVQQLNQDLQKVYRPLALLLFISFGVTIASLQGLLFLYLLDHRNQEIETLQESGLAPLFLWYAEAHDLLVIGAASFVFCVCLYLALFLRPPSSSFMFASVPFSNGIGYTFILMLALLMGACFYVWWQRNKKKGRKRK